MQLRNLTVVMMLSPAWISTIAAVDSLQREAVYGGAVMLGGQVAPLFDKGYLIYLHQPNRLQVFGPDTQLAFEYEVPCPDGQHQCSTSAVAVDGKGNLAMGIGYRGAGGLWTAGIRFTDPRGVQLRFVQTSGFVPQSLTFDRNGDLWCTGWLRDPVMNDSESKEDYKGLRKYSPDGKLLGEFLPRSLWPQRSAPFAGSRGYWTMYAGRDRVGVLVHGHHANTTPEWVEWDLDGGNLRRTPVSARMDGGRAFAGPGRLYAQSLKSGSTAELNVLDTVTGTWKPARMNIPDRFIDQGPMLLGADGDNLVYRVGRGGNVHLVWARPE